MPKTLHNFPPNIPVILASGSPRRQELLASINVQFTIIKPNVDEESFDTDTLNPSQLVEFLAQKKAEVVAQDNQNAIVIGSDTVVAINGKILGKPHSKDEAFAMLKELQNNRHQVISGIAISYQDRCRSSHAITQVTMNPMTDEQIQQYIATGEPMDKAGAYAIQGYTSLFIPKIEGCYFNVVGMSLNLLNTLIKDIN